MIELTQLPIDQSLLLEKVRSNNAGGLVLFLGTVRELTGEIRTKTLEYQAHEPMALAKMHQLEQEARQRWPIQELAMVHRLGSLSVGEVAVGVAVSCPHRKEAFEACAHLIDRLKEIVPIWKKEVAPDGQGDWVHPV
ncbi:molybdenum cofactor biosynthesis protein MoaE [Telmatocola sphagniphila]|jgi:molybdopterin synthase catalytic subunit|uniref:Molybdopterin synthase catalytic subunit n=1 Tax=Telmatocola sphagniphila TaxID=1123043 RepID=A0A8E6B776_9BACT|nr:molybdenum cofactor biosynthesis protein MoaE [Telmatocola sphagniphila]QVL32421.1 molybdenum cofactor biosynthesis protein MoaE [Telmatocola sphagniphila]